MESDPAQEMTREDELFEWAGRYINIRKRTAIRDAPWGKTYRLDGDDSTAFLKIMPEHQANVCETTAFLSRKFADKVPQLIAASTKKAALLSKDHGGMPMTYDSPTKDMQRLLASYAEIQAQAVDLKPPVPDVDLASLPDRFLRFLDPRSARSPTQDARVGIAYFVGRSEAKRYFETLSFRRDLLERHIEPAFLLPKTLNHGDLRPPNAAILANGTIVLCDWDDAVAGPAGLSLHALFSGCTKIARILNSDDGVSDRAIARLDAYVTALVDGGYAEEASLRAALPATACAGVLQYLINFARYPRNDRDYRRAVRRSISRRMSDLMNLCDILAVRDGTARLHAQQYLRTGQSRRSLQLVDEHILDHPDDAKAHVLRGDALKTRGYMGYAKEAYRWASELAPGNAAPWARLGSALLHELDFRVARDALGRAIELEPDLTSAQEDLKRTQELAEMQATAARSDTTPRIAISDAEAACGAPRPEAIKLAASLFETYGALQVDNVFPVAKIEALRDAFFKRYESYFRKDDHPDALRVGNQRYMLTIDIEKPFDDPAIYASPILGPLFQRLLGEDLVIGAFTSVISLPGSADQRLHKDHPPLFPSTAMHHDAPSFAVQMIIPLVGLDDRVGTTRIVKGSHRVASRRASKMKYQDPVIPLGSCLITDYRVSHRGIGNRSDIVRPILTIIYNRPWFRDYANYTRQPPLRLGDDVFGEMSEENRKLFAWWKQAHSV